jgi:microcystin-dependent protein
MSTPYVGEIRMFAGNFAPLGWWFCDGSLLPISENEALFQLIGTTYGGDGQSTFAVPDLRGRIPIHQGQGAGLTNRVIGESSGSEQVTLTVQQMPGHRHPMASTDPSTSGDPLGKVVGNTGATPIYGSGATTVAMDAGATQQVGGNQPHDNMMPFQCINYIISLFGIFPSQS